MLDYIVNGRASGNIAGLLQNHNMDPNVLRPYCYSRDPYHPEYGKTYLAMWDPRAEKYDEVLVNEGHRLSNGVVLNASSTLLKDEWIELDAEIHRVARAELGAVASLRSNGMQRIIPNGMAKTVFESHRQSDTTDAIVSMEPRVQGPSDRPEYDLVGVPLPIIHRDFDVGARQQALSSNGSANLETENAGQATRKVLEMADKLCIGVADMVGIFGGYPLYGITNYPQRITRAITDPATGSNDDIINDILAMRQDAYDAFHRGPYMLWVSPGWDQYLDVDYSANKGSNTLRERILQIQGIDSIERIDYMPDLKMVLIQKDRQVAREIVGMDVTTVMWDEMGGLQRNFKIMAIMVCQPRSDYNGNTGLVDGTVA